MLQVLDTSTTRIIPGMRYAIKDATTTALLVYRYVSSFFDDERIITLLYVQL